MDQAIHSLLCEACRKKLAAAEELETLKARTAELEAQLQGRAPKTPSQHKPVRSAATHPGLARATGVDSPHYRPLTKGQTTLLVRSLKGKLEPAEWVRQTGRSSDAYRKTLTQLGLKSFPGVRWRTDYGFPVNGPKGEQLWTAHMDLEARAQALATDARAPGQAEKKAVSPGPAAKATWAGVAVKTLGRRRGQQIAAIAPKHLERLYRGETTFRALAKELRVSQATIARRLTEWRVANDLPPPRRGESRHITIPEDKLRLVMDEGTAQALGDEYGCSAGTVYQRVRELKARARAPAMEAPPGLEPSSAGLELAPLELYKQPPPYAAPEEHAEERHEADDLLDKLEARLSAT